MYQAGPNYNSEKKMVVLYFISNLKTRNHEDFGGVGGTYLQILHKFFVIIMIT